MENVKIIKCEDYWREISFFNPMFPKHVQFIGLMGLNKL